MYKWNTPVLLTLKESKRIEATTAHVPLSLLFELQPKFVAHLSHSFFH